MDEAGFWEFDVGWLMGPISVSSPKKILVSSLSLGWWLSFVLVGSLVSLPV